MSDFYEAGFGYQLTPSFQIVIDSVSLAAPTFFVIAAGV